jgi:hypothetical protein
MIKSYKKQELDSRQQELADNSYFHKNIKSILKSFQCNTNTQRKKRNKSIEKTTTTKDLSYQSPVHFSLSFVSPNYNNEPLPALH